MIQIKFLIIFLSIILISIKNILNCLFFFFFNDTATTEIYTLSLHDALPISRSALTERPITGTGVVTRSPSRTASPIRCGCARSRCCSAGSCSSATVRAIALAVVCVPATISRVARPSVSRRPSPNSRQRPSMVSADASRHAAATPQAPQHVAGQGEGGRGEGWGGLSGGGVLRDAGAQPRDNKK